VRKTKGLGRVERKAKLYFRRRKAGADLPVLAAGVSRSDPPRAASAESRENVGLHRHGLWRKLVRKTEVGAEGRCALASWVAPWEWYAECDARGYIYHLPWSAA
jgi:hypothetical protein